MLAFALSGLVWPAAFRDEKTRLLPGPAWWVVDVEGVEKAAVATVLDLPPLVELGMLSVTATVDQQQRQAVSDCRRDPRCQIRGLMVAEKEDAGNGCVLSEAAGVHASKRGMKAPVEAIGAGRTAASIKARHLMAAFAIARDRK